uniref:Uncharacterized protein n=1 Tax=Pararge aegeria TaxID=116150 RepID=S4NK13_9NEOP
MRPFYLHVADFQYSTTKRLRASKCHTSTRSKISHSSKLVNTALSCYEVRFGLNASSPHREECVVANRALRWLVQKRPKFETHWMELRDQASRNFILFMKS